MQRTRALAALVALLSAGGCGAVYPTETRVITRNWVGAPLSAQFQFGPPDDNTPVPYCYNTLGRVECHYYPLPPRESGRFVNAYTGATRPKEDDEKRRSEAGQAGEKTAAAATPAPAEAPAPAPAPGAAKAVQAPLPLTQVSRPVDPQPAKEPQ